MILKAEEPVPERHTPLLLQVVNYGIYIVPKHAKRYAEKPDLNCHLEDCVTVLEDTDNRRNNSEGQRTHENKTDHP